MGKWHVATGLLLAFDQRFFQTLQVPPAELEDLIRSIPEVEDVAVIGINGKQAIDFKSISGSGGNPIIENLSKED